jgi:hypothetical protein
MPEQIKSVDIHSLEQNVNVPVGVKQDQNDGGKERGAFPVPKGSVENG